MGIKISELESTSTANANDVFVINQNGKTKKITKQILQNQMKNLELEEELEDLEKEIEILSETIDSELEDGVATGESITVNDSARAKAVLDVGGNTDQKQYKGYQLIDFNDLNVISTTTYNFTNDILTVNSTTNTYRRVSKNIIDLIKKNAGKQLYFNYETIDISSQFGGIVQILVKDENGTTNVSLLRHDLTHGTYSIPEDTSNITEVRLDIFSNNSNTSQSASVSITKPMLQFGTEELPYEPYVGGQASPNPEYPQEVQVVKGSNTIKVSNKNWFDKDNTHSINAYINTSTMKFASSSTVKTYWIACQPNTTYTIQKILSKQFRVGTSNEIPSVDSSLLQAFQNNDITQYTTTTDSQAKYLCINIRNSSSDTLTEQEILDSIQIEKSSTATYYAEHEEQTLTLTLPQGMEMCKIADYKDGFVKDLDSGKWYKNKEIQKLVLNGTERWTTDSIPEGHPRHSYSKTNYKIDFLTPLNNDTKATALSNVGIVTATETANGRANGVAMHPNGNIYVDETTYNNLSSVNVVLYGVLATSALEEITDETLISQLDKLYEVMTYYGQTNVTCEGDGLSPIFTLNYKKSNRLRLENIENRLALLE